MRNRIAIFAPLFLLASFFVAGIALAAKPSGAKSRTWAFDFAEQVDLQVGQPEYDPFGRRSVFDANGNLLSVTAVQNLRGYTSHLHDFETGFIYMRNRYIHPGIGRFLTLDPLGVWYDRANWGNGYGYGGGNPITIWDPHGEFGWLLGAFVGAIAGAVIEGGLALIQGKSWQEAGEAAAKGAATGAAIGSGLGLLEAAGAGALGGGATIAQKVATAAGYGLAGREAASAALDAGRELAAGVSPLKVLKKEGPRAGIAIALVAGPAIVMEHPWFRSAASKTKEIFCGLFTEAKASGAAVVEDVLSVTGEEAGVAARGGVRFAQRGVSSTFRHGEFAGRTIDDVAAGLQSGAITPGQLPIQTITRDGVTYTLNNRSLMALRLAGMEPTVIRDVTGNAFFEGQLTQRLGELGGQVGADFVPIIRGGN